MEIGAIGARLEKVIIAADKAITEQKSLSRRRSHKIAQRSEISPKQRSR
jgi:hypothetical protein